MRRFSCILLGVLLLLELSGAATARAEERAKASVVVAFVDRATKGEEGKTFECFPQKEETDALHKEYLKTL